MVNLSFHQAELFIAQNGKDRVRLRDFVVFCRHTNSELGSQPSVSNTSWRTDGTLIQEFPLDQLAIGRVVEILVLAENSNQASRRTPRKLGVSHVTVEVYDFDKERHKVWDAPCIQPSESENFVVVAAKVCHPLPHLTCVDTSTNAVGNLLYRECPA
jgi:hypothetical protein